MNQRATPIAYPDKPDNQDMEALATVVFERTPSGAVAIKAAGDEVPRRLRSLLLAVDGRSPVAQYVPFLTAFAPLSEKFSELEQMGYLRRKGSVASEAVDPFERAQSSGFGALLPLIDAASPNAGFVPIAQADLAALATSASAMQARNVANGFELELQALARQMTAPVPSPSHAAQAAMPATQTVAPTAKLTLTDLLGEMDAYLSRFAGADALPISLMLEQIKTLAQLRSELPQYFELVRRYGPSAEPHIERLANIIDKASD